MTNETNEELNKEDKISVKIKDIMKQFKMHNNINYTEKELLDYFNKLSDNDKYILIKFILHSLLILEENYIKLDDDICHVKTEIKSIEEYDKHELIKLKTWFIKTLFLLSLAIFSIFMFFTIFIDNENKTVFSALDNIFDLIKLVF